MRILIAFAALMVALTVQAFGLYYGVPVDVPMDNIGGVSVEEGETPFPEGSVFPVPLELRTMPAKYLKVVAGNIVLKTVEEQGFADLPPRHKKQVEGVWVELSAAEKHLVDLPVKYRKSDGTEMTPEEKVVVDAAEIAAEDAKRQSMKALKLKTAENTFLAMCDQLSGTTAHAKLGFDILRSFIGNLPAEQQLLVTVNLLVLDAELKREGGNLWWDDCAWHPDIVE